MTTGPGDLERRQLNWAHVHRVVSSCLAKRVSLTKIANLHYGLENPRESKGLNKLKDKKFGNQNR